MFTCADCPTLVSRRLPPIFGKSSSWRCRGRCTTEQWKGTPRPDCRMTRTPCWLCEAVARTVGPWTQSWTLTLRGTWVCPPGPTLDPEKQPGVGVGHCTGGGALQRAQEAGTPAGSSWMGLTPPPSTPLLPLPRGSWASGLLGSLQDLTCHHQPGRRLAEGGSPSGSAVPSSPGVRGTVFGEPSAPPCASGVSLSEGRGGEVDISDLGSRNYGARTDFYCLVSEDDV